MNHDPIDVRRAALSRRRFLIAGGASVSLGALLAACGGGGSSTGIPRIGLTPDPTELPDAPVTDVALLRTASALEYNAIFAYETAAGLGVLTGDAKSLAGRFLDDHKRHADTIVAATEAAGGNPWTEPNPRLQSIYVEPALALIAESDDQLGDVLALAYALETLAGATYQSFVPLFDDKALRAAAMGNGEEEGRHAATLGLVLNPSRLVTSTGLSIADEFAETETATFYAVPSAFGTLSPVPVTLGPADENGARTTVNLETPSLNSLVYEYFDEE